MGVEPVHRAGQLASGWLGAHTASIDWCEDNYAVTRYIAEFWNTVSNLPFMFLGFHGAYRSISEDLPHATRFALLHASIGGIGMGSMIFHLTLKWHAQVMLDELPMVFSASLSVYILLASKYANQSSSDHLKLKAAMFLLPVVVSAAYLAYPDPVLHQVCYAAIMISGVILVQEDYRSPDLSPAIIRQAKDLNVWGTIIFLAGFAIWNVDNLFCDSLHFWRSGVGEYIGSISQGHAWWHLLTGLGGSRIATGLTYLTLSKELPGQFEVVNSNGLLPYVRRVRTVASNGHANGNGAKANGVANGNGRAKRE